MMMFILMLVISIMTVLLIFLSYMLSEKYIDKEKTEIYECGFTPIMKLGFPFSVSFFIIAILFLMFDLEIMLLFPWSMSTYFYLNFESFLIIMLFMMMLTLGLVYEWMNGGLEWD